MYYSALCAIMVYYFRNAGKPQHRIRWGEKLILLQEQQVSFCRRNYSILFIYVFDFYTARLTSWFKTYKSPHREYHPTFDRGHLEELVPSSQITSQVFMAHIFNVYVPRVHTVLFRGSQTQLKLPHRITSRLFNVQAKTCLYYSTLLLSYLVQKQSKITLMISVLILGHSLPNYYALLILSSAVHLSNKRRCSECYTSVKFEESLSSITFLLSVIFYSDVLLLILIIYIS